MVHFVQSSLFSSSFSERFPKRHEYTFSRFGQSEILLNLNCSTGICAGTISNVNGSSSTSSLLLLLYRLLTFDSAMTALPSISLPNVGHVCRLKKSTSGNWITFRLARCCDASFAELINFLHRLSLSAVGKNSGKYALLANGSSGNSFMPSLFFHMFSYSSNLREKTLFRSFSVVEENTSFASVVVIVALFIFFTFSPNASKYSLVALRYASPNLFNSSKLAAFALSRNSRIASAYPVSSSTNILSVIKVFVSKAPPPPRGSFSSSSLLTSSIPIKSSSSFSSFSSSSSVLLVFFAPFIILSLLRSCCFSSCSNIRS